MKVRRAEQIPPDFDFRHDSVLVVEEFWSREEAERLRGALATAPGRTHLEEMPGVARTFANCGNWLKAEVVEPELSWFISRTLLPCVSRHVQSFEGVTGGVMSFQYYAYAVGDGLSVHDDTDSGDERDPDRPSVKRRVALATYFHERWHADWGGELVLYDRPAADGPVDAPLHAREIIVPAPRSLALFAVPRLHRVCRVDPLAGEHRRLSVAGWFMTRHDGR